MRRRARRPAASMSDRPGAELAGVRRLRPHENRQLRALLEVHRGELAFVGRETGAEHVACETLIAQLESFER